MTIRKSDDRLQLIDERILQHLQEERMSTTTLMAANNWIHGSKDQIRERCEYLYELGFIHKITDRTFEIDGEGIYYLDGKIAPDDPPDDSLYDGINTVLRGKLPVASCSSNGDMPEPTEQKIEIIYSTDSMRLDASKDEGSESEY